MTFKSETKVVTEVELELPYFFALDYGASKRFYGILSEKKAVAFSNNEICTYYPESIIHNINADNYCTSNQEEFEREMEKTIEYLKSENR